MKLWILENFGKKFAFLKMKGNFGNFCGKIENFWKVKVLIIKSQHSLFKLLLIKVQVKDLQTSVVGV